MTDDRKRRLMNEGQDGSKQEREKRGGCVLIRFLYIVTLTVHVCASSLLFVGSLSRMCVRRSEGWRQKNSDRTSTPGETRQPTKNGPRNTPHIRMWHPSMFRLCWENSTQIGLRHCQFCQNYIRGRMQGSQNHSVWMIMSHSHAPFTAPRIPRPNFTYDPEADDKDRTSQWT